MWGYLPGTTGCMSASALQMLESEHVAAAPEGLNALSRNDLIGLFTTGLHLFDDTRLAEFVQQLHHSSLIGSA